MWLFSSPSCVSVCVQYESNLEGHAAPGGENVPAQATQRQRLEDQRSGAQR